MECGYRMWTTSFKFSRGYEWLMNVGIKINKLYGHRETRFFTYSCCLYFVIKWPVVARECII
jgi:hypothetical protein